MEDEATETAVLKSELIHEPDLLSDVSEMKQDLIKMTAILTADATAKSHSLGGCGLEKGPVDVSGEPLEIMEKDLEKVKEDLEKVSEILRNGTFTGEAAEDVARAARMTEEWVLLTDTEIQDAKIMAALEVQEPVLRENRGNRGAPRPKGIKDSGDLKEYLLDVPVSPKTKDKKETVQTDVLRKSSKPVGPTKPQEIASGESKKPVRRKAKGPGQVEDSSDTGALLHVPEAAASASPVSPVVEETPIGSIKDKVKALQQKVEAEQKSRNVPGSKPSQLPVMTKLSPKAKDNSKSKQAPTKGPSRSPKAESEKLEETMSVRELMQVFQTGQDPSKRKSGLFELKTSIPSRPLDIQKPESIQSKSVTKAKTSLPGGREVSLDSKPSKKGSAPQDPAKEPTAAGQVPLVETADFGRTGFDDSSDSLKHEGGVDSLSASSGDGTPHMSSEDSYKHEGLATPGTSPESMCFSPKMGQHTSTTLASTLRDKKESKDTEKSDVGTAGDHLSTEMRLPVTSREAADDHATSESCSVKRSESKSKHQKLTKRVSETVETFLSDEDSPDHQLELSLVGLTPRSSSQCQESFTLPLKQDSDVLSPLADDSLTISHRDSLEGSPLPEENSSHKSPDSIEPSPTNESPPHDSLETSPVEQRSPISKLSLLNPPSESCSHPEPFKSADFPQDYLRGRLLQDPEASAEDNSCEQTSQMTSSGKSPLSPDTPSSEEVSYEVTPRPPSHAFHFHPSQPSVIPEDPEEGDTSYSIEANKQITPEEEMFKMAAKIKTFDEMEQDERSQKNSRKDLCPSVSEISDTGYERLEAPTNKTSQIESGLRPAEASNVDLSVDPHVKVQPPFPLPAGLHEGSHMKEVKSTTTAARVTSEGHYSVPDLQLSISKQQHVQQVQERVQEAEEKVSSGKKTSAPSNTQNRTDEQKEQSLKKSRETTVNDRNVQESSIAGPEDGSLKKDSNVTDEMKGDQMHTGASNSRTVASAQTEMFKAELCVYDETEEEEVAREPPKTESKGVTARVDTESWSAMRDDDAAFAARVKEEEQKILNLVVDRQSLQATPDTTPGRTPTEESTPTSEPNPFLFQEGKLFEMTRSGAIDMTKRSYEEEGGGFAFFQIGDQPSEEPFLEDMRQEAVGANVEIEVGLNLTLEVKTEDTVKSKEGADTAHQSTTDEDQYTSAADTSKSKIPKMGVSASAKLSKKDQTPPEGVDCSKTEGCVDIDTDSPDQMTTVQTAEMTVTRSVYSQQSQESSDSSPEETKSVIETPKPTSKCKPNAPSAAKKAPGKTPAKSAPSGRGKSTIPSPSHAATPLSAGKKESLSSESKSRIPIKAGGVKADSHAKRVESTQDKKLKVPMKKDTRRKSEADAGPSGGVKSKTPSSKAKSFCEGESSRPAAKKAAESTKSRSFQSRLPVRGKSGQTSVPSTPTKEKSAPLKETIEFFEEISDEAAKLVARLVQAETEKEQEAAAANSDEESSLIDPVLIERESFLEMQPPPSGDVFPIRPLWDHPVETQMQRIPDDRAQSQGTPST